MLGDEGGLGVELVRIVPLERVGDQACNLCEYVQLVLSEPELKKLLDLPRMAEIATSMVEDSLG